MFIKLAGRNVKRQFGNYMIYFITVVLMMSLMFAMNNMSFCDSVKALSLSSDNFTSALIVITVFVTLATSFILGYATSYMLKLRRKEFGMYMTLGMTKGNILKLFLCENAILYTAALVSGIIIGAFLYQGIMALLSVLMDVSVTVSAYSSEGLILTLILGAVMFFIASVSSVRYLRKVTISELLRTEKQEKTVKHPIAWSVAALASLIGFIWSFYQEFDAISKLFSGEDNSPRLVFMLPVVGVFIFLLHMTSSKGLMGILMYKKQFSTRETNRFILRQLSGKMSVNAALIGVLSVLFSFAVLLSNVSFGEKTSDTKLLEKEHPFDIVAQYDEDGEQGFTIEEGEEIISRYNKITGKREYNLWENGNCTVFERIPVNHGQNEEDIYMKMSEFNMLCSELGLEELTDEGKYYLVTGFGEIKDEFFDDCIITYNNMTYSFGRVITNIPFFVYQTFYIIIPDEAVVGMELRSTHIAYDLESEKYDAKTVYNSLSYSRPYEDFTISCCDYSIRELRRVENNASVGIIIICMLYVSIVFVCMALAILSIKVLSGLQEDKQRYELLRRLGADSRLRKKTLFKQTFSFFFMPFVIPILTSIPTCMFNIKLYKLQGFSELLGSVVADAVIIAIAMMLIYGLYFMVTYLISRKSIIYGGTGRIAD